MKLNETLSGVIIGSAECHDLVEIKLTESQAEHRSRLRLRRLRSNENFIVGVGSRNGRINQSQENEHCDWFILPLMLPTPKSSFHWIVSDGVIGGYGVLLPTPSV